MQRPKFLGVALVALGVSTIVVGVLAQQAPANREAAAAGAAGRETGECRIAHYCPGVPGQYKETPRPAPRAITAASLGPGSPGGPPPIMWREPWKMPFTVDPGGNTVAADEKRRTKYGVVSNSQLELKLYGPDTDHVLVYLHEGVFDLWTGLSSGPIAVMLRDKDNFASIPARAMLRVTARTNGLHRLHPALKLADGSFLIGDGAVDTESQFKTVDILLNGRRWFYLDPNQIVVMRGVPSAPDLSKVDEVGVVDLAPAAGHHGAGWVNISTLELLANKVPR